MKKKLPAWATLLIITMVAGLALGCTDALTKGPIKEQASASAEKARQESLPNADHFTQLKVADDIGIDWCYAGYCDGEIVGYVCQVTTNGFGGEVEVIAGVDLEQTVTGISVGGSNFSETAGLGAKSKEPAFTDQFKGKIAPLTVIKNGGIATESTIDAITSATITSTAVTNAVNLIAEYVLALN